MYVCRTKRDITDARDSAPEVRPYDDNYSLFRMHLLDLLCLYVCMHVCMYVCMYVLDMLCRWWSSQRGACLGKPTTLEQDRASPLKTCWTSFWSSPLKTLALSIHITASTIIPSYIHTFIHTYMYVYRLIVSKNLLGCDSTMRRCWSVTTPSWWSSPGGSRVLTWPIRCWRYWTTGGRQPSICTVCSSPSCSNLSAIFVHYFFTFCKESLRIFILSLPFPRYTYTVSIQYKERGLGS